MYFIFRFARVIAELILLSWSCYLYISHLRAFVAYVGIPVVLYFTIGDIICVLFFYLMFVSISSVGNHVFLYFIFGSIRSVGIPGTQWFG